MRAEGNAWNEWLKENGLYPDEAYMRHSALFKAVEEHIDSLGYTDMPEHLYNKWMEDIQAEIERREREGINY